MVYCVYSQRITSSTFSLFSLFLTVTYFIKARHSLFVPKMPLNHNQSISLRRCSCKPPNPQFHHIDLTSRKQVAFRTSRVGLCQVQATASCDETCRTLFRDVCPLVFRVEVMEFGHKLLSIANVGCWKYFGLLHDIL